MLYEVTLENSKDRDPIYPAYPGHRPHVPELFAGAQEGFWFDRFDGQHVVWRIRCTSRQAEQLARYFKAHNVFFTIKVAW